MPIQFRCQYCRQLLGISKSRAGSAVDCPACGRTLRVPAAEGSVDAAEDSSRFTADVSLRNALEELSSLASPSSATRPVEIPAGPVPRIDPLRSSAAEADGQRDSMRIVPLSIAAQSSSPDSFSRESDAKNEGQYSTEMTATETPTPVPIPTLVNPETTEMPSNARPDRHSPSGRAFGAKSSITAALDRPADLESALQELAGPDGVLDLSGPEARNAALSPRPKRLPWLVGTAVALLVAFGLGVAVGRSSVNVSGETKAVAVQDAARAANGDGVAVVDAISGDVVTGRVMYSEGAGSLQPDSGAFVLLVPTENKSGLKLNAEPWRDRQLSDAKLAVEASIRVLKGSMTRCSEDGTFTVERRDAGPLKLVVISRHVSRSDGEPAEPAASQTLADWFESPSQLTGRLQVQEKLLPVVQKGDDSPVEVAFRKQ